MGARRFDPMIGLWIKYFFAIFALGITVYGPYIIYMEDKTKASVMGVVAAFSLVIGPSLHALHPEKEPHSEKPTLTQQTFILPPHAHTHEEHRVPVHIYQNLLVDTSSSSSINISLPRIFLG